MSLWIAKKSPRLDAVAVMVEPVVDAVAAVALVPLPYSNEAEVVLLRKLSSDELLFEVYSWLASGEILPKLEVLVPMGHQMVCPFEPFVNEWDCWLMEG